MRLDSREFRAACAVIVVGLTLSACTLSSPSSPTLADSGSSEAFAEGDTVSLVPSRGSGRDPAPAQPGGGPSETALSIANISPTTATVGTFTLTVNGTGFDASTARIIVVGPSCATTDACVVSNAELTTKTTSTIIGPVTLNTPGTFSIHVQNGSTGSFSRGATLFVTDETTPSIGGISPARPTTSTSSQTLSVTGANFVRGLSATVVRPDGETFTLTGSQIQNVTRSSFQMSIVLVDAGPYSVRANNPDGQQSNTFSFTVAPAAGLPVISSLSPSNPRASAVNQALVVSGSNFQPELMVTVVGPGGRTSTLRGSDIQNVTSGSFEMIIILADAGAYSLRVNNSNGQQSNTFSFMAVPNGALPSISSISPASPTASAASQTVSVSGSNFQQGLSVTVVGPGGSISTLSESQIRSVTSGSFQMIVTLRDPGAYTLRVINPNGQQSNTFSFTAKIRL
jgi:hypothetical protein